MERRLAGPEKTCQRAAVRAGRVDAAGGGSSEGALGTRGTAPVSTPEDWDFTKQVRRARAFLPEASLLCGEVSTGLPQ